MKELYLIEMPGANPNPRSVTEGNMGIVRKVVQENAQGLLEIQKAIEENFRCRYIVVRGEALNIRISVTATFPPE